VISQEEYTFLDRLTHRLAFSSPAVQLSAAGVETMLFASEFREVPIREPVFITSLPRAGTTLLLEVLTRESVFASQRYRDMPFVLAPLLWHKVSHGFHRAGMPKTRAHGDGMRVTYDSAEAFEEVVWKACWPERFKGNTIPLWGEGDRSRDFEELFRRHIQKVVALRASVDRQWGRYVSKNNANLTRVKLLRALFEDGVIVVPFRNPVHHAASMHRQHLRFLEIHEREPFTKRYMRDIGHFEFGELHRPLAFPGLDGLRSRYVETTLDYWVGYWLLAFRHVLGLADEVVLVSYDQLVREGTAGLRRLGESIGLSQPTSLESAAAILREPTSHDVDLPACDSRQLEEARALHDRLSALSVV
jgi:hypothetical protein